MDSRVMPSRVFSFTLLMVLVSFFLNSCGKDTLYHTYHSLPLYGWGRVDTLCYEYLATDSLGEGTGMVMVEVRHRSDYPYRNLPMLLQVLQPDSTLMCSDTLQLFLADGEGQWLGSGFGSLYQAPSLPVGRFLFSSGTYSLRLNHLLPDSLVRGVNDVGIRIVR